MPAIRVARIKHGDFDRRFEGWRSKGLSTRAAGILALWGCDSVTDVQRLGQVHFEKQGNLGAKTRDEVSRLAGWSSVCSAAVDTAARSALTNSNRQSVTNQQRMS